MTTTRHDEAWVVPVFPLPNVVLFPQTVLPLQVFEARYRSMIHDILEGSGQLVIALLKPGFESDYKGSPPIHPLGTIGRIEELQLLEDGRFLFNLVGMQRVDLEEVPSSKPYRLVRARPRPDLTIDEHDPELDRSKLELLASRDMLMRELGDDSAESMLFNSTIAFDRAVNDSCATLPAAAEIRQALLELDDPRQRQQQALRMIDRALEEVLSLKAAPDDPPAADLN